MNLYQYSIPPSLLLLRFILLVLWHALKLGTRLVKWALASTKNIWLPMRDNTESWKNFLKGGETGGIYMLIFASGGPGAIGSFMGIVHPGGFMEQGVQICLLICSLFLAVASLLFSAKRLNDFRKPTSERHKLPKAYLP